MKTLSDPNEAIWAVPKTPARRALDANLVTEADLLRLKVMARLHARGLPPHISWSDLLQEAFTRVLDGSRRQPEGVPMVAFLSGVMRSIKEQLWREARRGLRQLPKLRAELGSVEFPEDVLPDPAPSPERSVIAMGEMEVIGQLFEDDVQARQVLTALYQGWSPEETCIRCAMSKTDYDSTRRRMRRVLIRVGLRSPKP